MSTSNGRINPTREINIKFLLGYILVSLAYFLWSHGSAELWPNYLLAVLVGFSGFASLLQGWRRMRSVYNEELATYQINKAAATAHQSHFARGDDRDAVRAEDLRA